MNARWRACVTLLAAFFGTAGANVVIPLSSGWSVGLVSGASLSKATEIVEARPEYAADYLSHLSWDVPAGRAGIDLSHRMRGILRINGTLWFLAAAPGGTLVNLDYLDSTSDSVTHRSVSTAELFGFGWELSTDLMLVEATRGGLYVRSFARVAYRGNYHSWKARGGEYEYPEGRGTFDADEECSAIWCSTRLSASAHSWNSDRRRPGSTGGWEEWSRRCHGSTIETCT